MSLKSFHIIFISASVLLCMGFGAWAFEMYRTGSGVLHLTTGMLSLATGAFLVWYGIRFLRKLKNVSFI